MSLNPTHGDVYLKQHYVIKFVRDLQQVSLFSWCTSVSSTNKPDCHNITEVLLKVVLNTHNCNPNNPSYIYFVQCCIRQIITWLYMQPYTLQYNIPCNNSLYCGILCIGFSK